MRSLFLAAVVLMTALSSGCASGPRYRDIADRVPEVSAGSGRLFFYRPAGAGALVQPKIRVNGEPVARSKGKGVLFTDQPPGDYLISLSTEVERAQTLVLREGETRYIEIEPRFGWFVSRWVPVLAPVDRAMKKMGKLRYYGDEGLLIESEEAPAAE